MLERDPLTGLKNRRSFDEHLQRIWLQAQRDDRAVAVLMVDVDDFKRYNDTYGHQAGDEALRRIGGVLREFGRRPLDLAARYGGEEFALIMNDVTVDHAGKVAEQLRAAVAGLGIPHAAARAADTVTLSIGVAVVKPALVARCSGLSSLQMKRSMPPRLRAAIASSSGAQMPMVSWIPACSPFLARSSAEEGLRGGYIRAGGDAQIKDGYRFHFLVALALASGT